MVEGVRGGSWLAVTLVGGAVLLAMALAVLELRSPPPPPPPAVDVAAAVAGFDADVRAARQVVDQSRAELQRLLEEQRQMAGRLVDPGPEPAWYHPMDHAAWEVRRQAYDEGIAAITAMRGRVVATQQQVETQLRVLADRERLMELARLATRQVQPEEIPGPVREAARWVWNALVRPLLHWLLVLALLFFALNRLCRLALIQGWLGEERV